MYPASRETPWTIEDDIAYRKCRPTKYMPGRSFTTPRSCDGSPSGRSGPVSIHEKSWLKPVAHATVPTSRTRPSSSTGRPSCVPVTRPVRSIPAASSCFGLMRINAPPCARNFGSIFRPIGVCSVNTRWNMKRRTNRSMNSRDAVPSMSNGMLPGWRPASTVSWPLFAASSASSTPELPAPITRTGPSANCEGLRYALEWN